MEKINMEKLEQLEKEIEQEFKNLSSQQQELLLCRKAIEIGKKTDKIKETKKSYNQDKNLEELEYLLTAADIGYLKPMVAYIMQKHELKIQRIYKDSLIHYNNILENYKNLAQELKISSSLDLSNLLTYMLWNGYFSVNKEHFYKLKGRLLLPGMFSFDAIKGKGVCLAYAELLKNYLSICGKESSLLTCKVPTGKKAISVDYIPEIKRNTEINISSYIFNKSLAFLLKGLINKMEIYMHMIQQI